MHYLTTKSYTYTNIINIHGKVKNKSLWLWKLVLITCPRFLIVQFLSVCEQEGVIWLQLVGLAPNVLMRHKIIINKGTLLSHTRLS